MPIENQRARASLRENEDHYRAVAEAATDAIITIDSDSTILIVNPATEKIFGYSSEEMIGQPLTMLMPDYLRHLHKAGIARYLETGRKHIRWSAVQLPGLHKTGNEVHGQNILGIIITAQGDDQLQAEAAAAGAIAFLKKPFKEEVLLAAIDSALKL